MVKHEEAKEVKSKIMRTVFNKFIVLIVVSSFIFSINIGYAHPGRTDKYGCYVCRTNCSRWGLQYGEYHCHNKKLMGGNKKKSSELNKENSVDKDKLTKLLLDFIDLNKRVRDVQTNLEKVNAQLSDIEEKFNFLKNEYNLEPKDEDSLIELINILKPHIEEMNKKLPIAIDVINSSFKLISDIKTQQEYSDVLGVYITTEAFVSSAEIRLKDLPKILNDLTKLLDMTINAYEHRKQYEQFRQGEYETLQRCNRLLSEIDNLRSQINSIRQMALDEAAKAGGIVTQSQVEEIVYNRTREIYNKIQDKILEMKMAGCDVF
ncbi:MAG: hypothetical protein KatS3mg097_561 [Candidatus Parcubacteria bacterium]|nr:MAG: hypothetical protein KatS3mg097_561 [Candidatus Parcubacteria bacterium]